MTHIALLHELYGAFFRVLEKISLNSDEDKKQLLYKDAHDSCSQFLSCNKYKGSNKIHFMNAISRRQLNIEVEPMDAIHLDMVRIDKYYCPLLLQIQA